MRVDLPEVSSNPIIAQIDNNLSRQKNASEMARMGLPADRILTYLQPINSNPAYSNTSFRQNNMRALINAFFPYGSGPQFLERNVAAIHNFYRPTLISKFMWQKGSLKKDKPFLNNACFENMASKIKVSNLTDMEKMGFSQTGIKTIQNLIDGRSLLKTFSENAKVNSFTETLKKKMVRLDSSVNQDDFEERLLKLPFGLGILGDFFYGVFSSSFIPSQIATVGHKKCSHGQSAFMNGLLATFEEGLNVIKTLSNFQGGNKFDLIYNSTLGLQNDLIKQAYIKSGVQIPAAKLFKQYIINYFEKADENQILHLSVHSQGGAILKNILRDIPIKYTRRMFVDTYGTGGYIEKDMAKRVRNYWHENDKISKLADRKGWEKAKLEGTLFVIKDDGRSSIEAHLIMGGYQKPLKQNVEAFAKGDF